MKRVALSEVKDDLSRFLLLAETRGDRHHPARQARGRAGGVCVGRTNGSTKAGQHAARTPRRIDARKNLAAGKGAKLEKLTSEPKASLPPKQTRHLIANAPGNETQPCKRRERRDVHTRNRTGRGRPWIAEIGTLPGVLAYGPTRDQAVRRAEALALRVLADRLDHGESVPEMSNVFSVAPWRARWPATKARRVLAACWRIGWQVKRQSGGSHRVLERSGWADYVSHFTMTTKSDRMLANRKNTGLQPGDL